VNHSKDLEDEDELQLDSNFCEKKTSEEENNKKEQKWIERGPCVCNQSSPDTPKGTVSVRGEDGNTRSGKKSRAKWKRVNMDRWTWKGTLSVFFNPIDSFS
jgi:hypothetical protein